MTLTVTHAKNVAIADDPKAAAAGEVLPSDWNANHTVSGVALENAGGNLTYYVATTGSDSNPGTVGSPFRTIQHAISIGLGFDYQSLYTLTINVADGTYNEVPRCFALLYGASSGSNANGFIIGNPLNPANVKILPNDGTGTTIFNVLGGAWALDGVSLVADNSARSNIGTFARADNGSILLLGTIIFDTGTGAIYNQVVGSENHSFISSYSGAGTNSWTIKGDGAAIATMFDCSKGSQINEPDGGFIFASAINMGGSPVFLCFSTSIFNLAGNFTTPANITNGPPVDIENGSRVLLGVDPTTITWPGGAFSTSIIDKSSTVDGFPYSLKKSGVPLAGDLYKGTFWVIEDTSGGTSHLSYLDSTGTLKQVALT